MVHRSGPFAVGRGGSTDRRLVSNGFLRLGVYDFIAAYA